MLQVHNSETRCRLWSSGTRSALDLTSTSCIYVKPELFNAIFDNSLTNIDSFLKKQCVLAVGAKGRWLPPFTAGEPSTVKLHTLSFNGRRQARKNWSAPILLRCNCHRPLKGKHRRKWTTSRHGIKLSPARCCGSRSCLPLLLAYYTDKFSSGLRLFRIY